MNTLVDFHYNIKRRTGHPGSFVLKFDTLVDLYIGRQREHTFKKVSVICFKTNYLSLTKLKEDYSIRKPRYPKINITHIKFKEYIPQAETQDKTLIELAQTDTDMRLIGIGTIGDEIDGTITESCSMTYGNGATMDYLEMLGREEVNKHNTTIKKEKMSETRNMETGELEKELIALVHYIFIDTGKKETIKMLTSGRESTTGPNYGMITEKIKTKEGTHHIQFEEKSIVSTIVTEYEDGYVRARNFAPIHTAQGTIYTLHGEYREYKKDNRGNLMPQTIITFNEGEVQKDIAETNGESLTIAVRRAYDYDKQLVYDHFQNKKQQFEDDTQEGDPVNKFMMFN